MNRYEVRIALAAKSDMRQIAKYISDELRNPDAARRLTQKMLDAAQSLSMAPERNALLADADLARRKLRMLVVENHNVFYVIQGSTVVVIRILYMRRDWMRILADKPE